jgi:hypothetical protein
MKVQQGTAAKLPPGPDAEFRMRTLHLALIARLHEPGLRPEADRLDRAGRATYERLTACDR